MEGTMPIGAWGASDVGMVKEKNEDSFAILERERVFVVADGVSGRHAGEVASAMAVDEVRASAGALRALLDEGDLVVDAAHRERVTDALKAMIGRANSAIYERGKAEHRGGMATTAVVLALGRDAGFVAHVGDSRVYLCRGDKVFRVTEDHTYAEELRRQAGDAELKINERFSHVLTRSLGGRPSVDVDVVFFELRAGDRLVLCSDGLTDYLSGQEILEYVRDRGPEDAIEAMIEEAKERGGRDNITALAVRVGQQTGEPTRRATTRVDTLRRVDFLEGMRLFQGLSRNELLRMMRVVYERSYAKGAEIVRQGDTSDAIYMIVEGGVAVARDQKLLATLEPGEHFGELSLFESAASSVSVVGAAEDTVLLAIPIERFVSLLRDEVALGNKLLWNVMRQLAGYVRTANERLVDEGIAHTLEMRAISREELAALKER